jgi:putative addiction module component (TIGR02574 family)
MSATLEDLKVRALQLTPPDRDELVRTLIASIDGEPEGSPEDIARAWDEEIERRIADLDSGKTVGIPAEQVLAEMRAMIAGHGKP